MLEDEKRVGHGLPSAEEVSSVEDTQMEWTPADERRIRRRMDLRIVPTVLALYLLCFIDR